MGTRGPIRNPPLRWHTRGRGALLMENERGNIKFDFLAPGISVPFEKASSLMRFAGDTGT